MNSGSVDRPEFSRHIINRWVANVAGTLDAVSPTLRTDVIGMFAKVDPRIGQMLTSQLSEGSRL